MHVATSVRVPRDGLQLFRRMRRNSRPANRFPTHRVRSFPVAECDDIVWIWMGAPRSADVDKIVRYP